MEMMHLSIASYLGSKCIKRSLYCASGYDVITAGFGNPLHAATVAYTSLQSIRGTLTRLQQLSTNRNAEQKRKPCHSATAYL